MLSLAVFFAAISIGTEVYSKPIQEIDLENILQYAQARENFQERKVRENKYDDYKNRYGALKSQEITELSKDSDKREYKDAEELLNEFYIKHKNRYNKNQKMTFGHYYDKNKDFDKNVLLNEEDNEFNDNEERYKHSQFNKQALEELLSKSAKKYQSKIKPQFVPLVSVDSNEGFNERNDDNIQDEYSKVYIILNPKAIEKSSNKENLNNLLSKILSLTSSTQETGRNKKYKDRKYKGFPIKSRVLARRARQDSKEMYARDSMDDDYKPKRSRADRGSGGGGVGGAGGRTAIPYIRNRGDIYERDH